MHLTLRLEANHSATNLKWLEITSYPLCHCSEALMSRFPESVSYHALLVLLPDYTALLRMYMRLYARLFALASYMKVSLRRTCQKSLSERLLQNWTTSCTSIRGLSHVALYQEVRLCLTLGLWAEWTRWKGFLWNWLHLSGLLHRSPMLARREGLFSVDCYAADIADLPLQAS